MWCAGRGWVVLPYRRPGVKYPGYQHWERSTWTAPDRVGAAWRTGCTAYGVLTGAASRLLVVDCDTPKSADDWAARPADAEDAVSGVEYLAILAAGHGLALPATYTVRTPSGGQHHYYRAPDAPLGNSVRSLGWCLDTRGDLGQVVGPGSTVDGLTYEVVDWSPPAPLPAWIAERLRTAQGTTASHGPTSAARPSPVRLSGSGVGPEWVTAALRGECERIRSAPDGQGNVVVSSAAYRVGQLVGGGLVDRAAAERDLLAALDTWTFTATVTREGRVRESAAGARARMVRSLRSGMAAGERSPRVPVPGEQRRRSA